MKQLFLENASGGCFYKKGVPKNFVQFIRKLESFLTKLQAVDRSFYLKKTQVQVFSYDFCDIFIEHLQATAFAYCDNFLCKVFHSSHPLWVMGEQGLSHFSER